MEAGNDKFNLKAKDDADKLLEITNAKAKNEADKKIKKDSVLIGAATGGVVGIAGGVVGGIFAGIAIGAPFGGVGALPGAILGGIVGGAVGGAGLGLGLGAAGAGTGYAVGHTAVKHSDKVNKDIVVENKTLVGDKEKLEDIVNALRSDMASVKIAVRILQQNLPLGNTQNQQRQPAEAPAESVVQLRR